MTDTRVSDEGYDRHACIWWRLLQTRVYLMKVMTDTCAPDEGYDRHACIWWRLLQTRIVHT